MTMVEQQDALLHHAAPGGAAPRTYIAGEDAGRLASAANYLGLHERRRPLQPVRDAVARLLHDSTLTAARMHSVGAIGRDEHVDEGGTLHLHLVSVRRRRRPSATGLQAATTYGSLQDLFAKEQQEVAKLEGQEQLFEEEEFLEEEDIVEGGSLQAAVFGIIKGTVGPAILYLPAGFQTSGYAVAVPAMFFATFSELRLSCTTRASSAAQTNSVSVLTMIFVFFCPKTTVYIYNAHRLLDCWKIESERNHKLAACIEEVRALLEPTAADETATAASPSFTPTLLTYPELARRAFGSTYSLLVDFGISSMQFGVCLTYLIFVPANLYQCTLDLFHVSIPKYYFLLAMILIEIPLSWITDIRKLTPTNVLATMLIFYGLCMVMLMAIVQSLRMDDNVDEARAFQENLATLPAVTESWFIFIGTSFFMMEGSITLLVPLQEAVFLPEDKAKFPAINQTVTAWIVMFYIFFSFICVAGFGEGLQTAMTASLRGSLASSVQLAYAVAVILTFPLQAFPAMEVTSKAILGEPKKHKSDNRNVDATSNGDGATKRQVLATVVTCLLGVIALVAIDYLGNVVSILGSLFGIPLALVFPPLMHNTLIKDSSKATRMMNYGVVLIGFFAMGAASFATIVSWNKGDD